MSNYSTQASLSTAIANLVSQAPATLDTLNELAAALGNDPNYATSAATLIRGQASHNNGRYESFSWPSNYNQHFGVCCTSINFEQSLEYNIFCR